ncbi:ferredoxin [Kitasatospora sp. NPDC059648]|uniref:ferredoxin n=1 Tax=Kitasatospora sp. NPDC059648 TaxID=3346894 RepID=UPI00367FEC9D
MAPTPCEVGVKIVVDLSRCERSAQCAFLAPEAFRMHGEEALMYDPNPDDAQRDQVLRAAAASPVQAILVDRLQGRQVPAEASPS